MIKEVSKCHECFDSDSFCISINCPGKSVKCLYCDECEEEVDELYSYYGRELCDSCLRDEAIIKEYYND